MMQRLRSFWIDINASYWFYPALFSVTAFLLALLTVYLDRHGLSEWLNDIDWIHPSRPAGARTVLTVIAGSMIGVASTVFSITIAAVAYASGNYGPRLLTNFMQDRGNQLSLATFIAAFVYALAVLRVVRGEDERPADVTDALATDLPGFTPQLSLLVATALAFAAVAVLVYFLHHIPDSIRINTVLKGIGRQLIADIEHRFPDEDGDAERRAPLGGQPVCASRTGYVKFIDFEALDEIARRRQAVVELKLRTGDFVHVGVQLLEIGVPEADGKLEEELRECFKLGGTRTRLQDIEFLIDELVEIALRALSPGINDPFTAITAIHWLGGATAELGRRHLVCGPDQELYDRDRVRPLFDGFEHFLRRGFGGMCAAAATNPLAALAYIDTLGAVARAAERKERRELLFGQARQLRDQARTVLAGPALAAVEEGYEQVAAQWPETQ